MKTMLLLTSRIKRKMLLSDWVDTVRKGVEDRARMKGREPSTALCYDSLKAHLRRFTSKSRYDKICLKEIDLCFCEGFVLYLEQAPNLRIKNSEKERKLAPGTRSKLFSMFETLLNKAVRSGLLKENPCYRMDPTLRPERPAKERAYLSKEELRILKETACKNDSVKKAFLFSCYCGLRWSDVVSLDWRNIRTDGETWSITKRMVKTGEWVFLPLNESARSLMPRQMTAGPVFRLPTPAWANAVIREWVQAAGIDKRITFHCARHSFATLLISQGADIYTTSKLMGHKNLATTQIYARIVDERKVSAVRLLDGLG